MELEKRFDQIQNLLSEHQSLINLEVLEQYPTIPSKYETWVMSIKSLSPDQRMQLENLDYFPKKQEYVNFIQQIKTLVRIPVFEKDPYQIPRRHLNKMTEKKRHEISRLATQLKSHQHFIDIGSGAAHLSGVLLDGNQKTSLCIDKDERIQSIGVNKQKLLGERINFKLLNFNKNTKLNLRPEQTLIGLHCCGDLSIEVLKFFKNHSLEALYNYGCCYHKLTQINLSSGAKLELSKHALTLAAKSYKTMTPGEYKRRDQIKRYRYTLHFIMHDHLNLTFQSVGNAKNSDYLGPFSEYCYKYLCASQCISSKKLNQLFDQYQSTYDDFLCFGILRSHFSRLIELYLILDRALYLKEHGFHVELEEVFERSISPRNICLKAYAKEA
jgi:hypothetical protein